MTTGSGDALAGLPLQLLALLVAVGFHRRRDVAVLAGPARAVFGRGLAAAYLAAMAVVWGQAVVLPLVAATSGWTAGAGEPRLAVPLAVVLVGCVLVCLLVAWRIRGATSELRGPVADLGGFFRVLLGTAVPAALRRLRAGR